MATLTLIYDGVEKVTRTVTVPDEHEQAYIDAHIERLSLHAPGKERPSDKVAIERHLDQIIHEINLVFAAHVNRKLVNKYIETLPTVRLK